MIRFPVQRQRGFIALIIFLGIIVVLSGVVVGGSFYVKASHPELLRRSFPPGKLSASASAQPSEVEKQNDPLKIFTSIFNRADYIITAQGEASFSLSSDPRDQIHLIMNSPLNFYTKQGKLVRIDDLSTSLKLIFLIQNDQIYRLDSNSKSHSVWSKTNPVWSYVNKEVQQRFIIQNIINDNMQNHLTWNQVENGVWQTNWIFETLLNKTVSVQLKLTVNTQTNLIDKTSFRLRDTDPWQDISWSYKPVLNIDELMVIPPEYKITISPVNLSSEPSGDSNPLTCAGLIFLQNDSPVTSVKATSGLIKITAKISGNKGVLNYNKAAWKIDMPDKYKNIIRYGVGPTIGSDALLLNLIVSSAISEPVDLIVQLTQIYDDQGFHPLLSCRSTLTINK